MKDQHRIEELRTDAEARESAASRSAPSEAIEAAIKRYLESETYHEHQADREPKPPEESNS